MSIKVSNIVNSEYNALDYIEIGFSGPVTFQDYYFPVVEGEYIGNNVWRLFFKDDFEGFTDGIIDFYLAQVEFIGSAGHYPNINFVSICDKEGLTNSETTTDYVIGNTNRSKIFN